MLILQGWAMSWVVIGHSTLEDPGQGPVWENTLYHIAYSFHMPLFMLVSGWLFYLTRLKVKENAPHTQWPYCKIVKDKTQRLLLPGIVFSVVAFVVKMVFPGEMSRQTGLSFSEVAHAYLYPYDNPLRELWFIVTLFWFFTLTPFWYYVIRNSYTKWGCLALLGCIHFINIEIDILCIGRVLSFAIWFYLGIIISKEEWAEKNVSKWPVLTLLVGVVVYIVGKYSISFVTTIGGIIFSFGFALIADKCIPKLFCSFRNYTYLIFLIGIFAQILVKIVYRHINTPYLLTYLLCIIAGLYVPVLVSKIIEWINWKPLLLCVGLNHR